MEGEKTGAEAIAELELADKRKRRERRKFLASRKTEQPTRKPKRRRHLLRRLGMRMHWKPVKDGWEGSWRRTPLCERARVQQVEAQLRALKLRSQAKAAEAASAKVPEVTRPR